MKLSLFHNPLACSGRSAGLEDEIRSWLTTRGHEVSSISMDPGSSPRAAVAAAAFSGVDGLLVAGGDGTLHEVVNGLAANPGPLPPIGLLPVGTGNAFARDLGFGPGAWQVALKAIETGKVRPVDLARVEGDWGQFHFINILGLGFVVRAGLAAQRLKMLGQGAYTIGTLAALTRVARLPLRLELDGEALNDEFIFMTLSNSRYTGTHFLIAPDARLDDGLLDLTLLRPLSRPRLLRLFPSIYDGSHLRYPEIETRKVKTLTIQAPADLPLMADGEFVGLTPMSITCLPSRLNFFSSQ